MLKIMVLQHNVRYHEARDWIRHQDQSQLTYQALLSHCKMLKSWCEQFQKAKERGCILSQKNSLNPGIPRPKPLCPHTTLGSPMMPHQNPSKAISSSMSHMHIRLRHMPFAYMFLKMLHHPIILLSYATLERLGIISFQVPNLAATTPIDHVALPPLLVARGRLLNG